MDEYIYLHERLLEIRKVCCVVVIDLRCKHIMNPKFIFESVKDICIIEFQS